MWLSCSRWNTNKLSRAVKRESSLRLPSHDVELFQIYLWDVLCFVIEHAGKKKSCQWSFYLHTRAAKLFLVFEYAKC